MMPIETDQTKTDGPRSLERSVMPPCPNETDWHKLTSDVYVTEKIEAYNVAIKALLGGNATGLARRLRSALAHKLDRDIQKWYDELPP